MNLPVTTIAFALLACAGATAQSSPRLQLFLPANVPSEKIEVRYALYGTFGAYSNFVKAKPDSALVAIPLTVKGSLADKIKAVAWAPGCRVATFDVKVSGLDLHESYSCEPLPSVLLDGQVEKSILARLQGPAEVRVDYLAGWVCDFFGFFDCMVPQLSVGAAKVDATGRFEITLPDFSSVPKPGVSSGVVGFHIALRELNTEDTALSPESKALRTFDGELRVASAYPSPVLFIEHKQN